MLQNRLTIKYINEVQANKKELAKRRRNAISNMASFKKDIDVKTIKEHIEYTKANFKLGKLKDLDIKAISKSMLLDTEFITLSNVQVVVTHYTRQNKPEQATNFLSNCIDMLDYDDNRRAVLVRVHTEIDENARKRKQNIEMIKDMEANAKTNQKQDIVAPQPIDGWEH